MRKKMKWRKRKGKMMKLMMKTKQYDDRLINQTLRHKENEGAKREKKE